MIGANGTKVAPNGTNYAKASGKIGANGTKVGLNSTNRTKHFAFSECKI